MIAINQQESAGFTLVEALVSLTLAVGIMTGLTYFMTTLFSSESSQTAMVTINGESFTCFRAGNPTAIQRSLDFHRSLMDLRDKADFITILGGNNFDPTGTVAAKTLIFSASGLSALSRSAWRNALAANKNLGFSSLSVFNTINALAPGEFILPATNANFSILFFNADGALLGSANHGCSPGTINNKSVNFYVAQLHALVGATWTQSASYGVYYPVAEDPLLNKLPCVTHYWHRNDTIWDRVEEGGSKIIFADPSLLGGVASSTTTLNDIQGLSRFTYFLPCVR